MIFRIFLVVACFLLILTFDVHGASDSFTVGTQIGTDSTAPTVPADFVATPVATTQIDLSWTASTDTFGVAGYQIFRDAAQIATTTQTTYSDAGLTESTLYTYYVKAFDNSGLYSSSSPSVATTTLSTPPVVATTTTTGGKKIELDSLPLELLSLEVIPATTSASINWETYGYVKSVLKWGRTLSFEEGTSAEEYFKKNHGTVITDLLPHTKYWFTIEGENGVGDYRVLTTGSFTTLSEPKDHVPMNVTNFRAVRNGNDILLSWNKPNDTYFSHVRLLGSHIFYPGDPIDGSFIYEGDATTAIEKGVAVPGTTRYYTIFTYDTFGNISSGAVVSVRITEDGGVVIEDPADTPVEGDPLFGLETIVFEQDNVLLEKKGTTIAIDGSKQLTIKVPYDVVPEHLKSIVVTLYEGHRDGPSFSFLLRANDERSFYEATLAPLGTSGTFPFSLSVFDFETRTLTRVVGTFEADIVFPLSEQEQNTVIPTFLSQLGYLPQFVLFLLFLLGIAYFLIRRRG